MGLLNLFSKPALVLTGLPSGSFTMDRSGRIVIATVPSGFPAATVQEIGRHIIETFRGAQAAQLPLSELTVNYGSLKISARELRGGAIVFLAPRNPISTTN